MVMTSMGFSGVLHHSSSKAVLVLLGCSCSYPIVGCGCSSKRGLRHCTLVRFPARAFASPLIRHGPVVAFAKKALLHECYFLTQYLLLTLCYPWLDVLFTSSPRPLLNLDHLFFTSLTLSLGFLPSYLLVLS
jgi:hypothetical protein